MGNLSLSFSKTIEGTMARPRLKEGDPGYEAKRMKAMERIVRITREKVNLQSAISELDRQIAEELEKLN